MRTEDFDFTFPKELIAQKPASPRDHSRLMIVNRKTSEITHEYFYNLPQYLSADDVMVFNNSKVVPYRLIGRRTRQKGKKEFHINVEILLLEETRPYIWKAIAKPQRRLAKDDLLRFGIGKDHIEFVVDSFLEDGTVLIRAGKRKDAVIKSLQKVGQMPTPPYITKKLKSSEQYQTIYAKVAGSAAAPTAGFHFTPKTFKDLAKLGIKHYETTLHVGLGTFKPMKGDKIEDHYMHSERIFLDAKTAHSLNAAKKSGKRIITVGTTSLRTLESLSSKRGVLKPTSKQGAQTDIFITPGYEFRFTDALLTNFHLPKTTLFVLVSAFADRELMLRAYKEAIAKKYRFFSFGDAMLII
ncbi:tRNA preQ1(34) S-adenosylmethionine ribosyltransferase-isomerase QueA [Patescibacteria group bacterium]